MGAGRKTETYTLPPNQDLSPYNVSARNLMKNHLGAVIFGCKNSTMNECLSKQLFGLCPQLSACFAPKPSLFSVYNFCIIFQYLNQCFTDIFIEVHVVNALSSALVISPKVL